MKVAAVMGILLIVLGVIALAYGGIPYTKEETVIDLGPVEAKTQTRKTIPLPPILGVLSLGAGVTLLIMRRKGSG